LSGNFVSLRSYGSTLTIDDKLLERARTVTDIQEKTALVRQALRHSTAASGLIGHADTSVWMAHFTMGSVWTYHCSGVFE